MSEKKTIRNHLILAAMGIGLQTAGSICILLASIQLTKEASRKIRQALGNELSRYLEEVDEQ